MEKQKRDSGIECLRLLAVWGIAIIHTFGPYYDTATGTNLVFGVAANSIFNAGVTVFEIISGYFGIKTSSSKLHHFWWVTTFCSLFALVISCIEGYAVGPMSLLRALFPIPTRMYWFATCYFVLMIFAPTINKLTEELSTMSFLKILSVLVCLFYLMPTVFGDGVMNDSGKGLANMIVAYCVGRFLRKVNVKISRGWFFLFLAIAIIINLVPNFVLSFMKPIGIYAPFARDCSITILILSIALFLLFNGFHFQSSVINRIAKHSLAMYLVGGASRGILNFFVDITAYETTWAFGIVIMIYCIGSMLICLLIDIIRGWIFDPIEASAFRVFSRISVNIRGHIIKKLDKMNKRFGFKETETGVRDL